MRAYFDFNYTQSEKVKAAAGWSKREGGRENGRGLSKSRFGIISGLPFPPLTVIGELILGGLQTIAH